MNDAAQTETTTAGEAGKEQTMENNDTATHCSACGRTLRGWRRLEDADFVLCSMCSRDDSRQDAERNSSTGSAQRERQAAG